MPEDATTEEKAAIMAVALASNTNEQVKKWLGENKELLNTAQKMLEEKNKVNKAKILEGYLKDLMQRILARLKGQKHVDCDKLKEEGITPEVRLGHSPLKMFGFPVYDPKSGRPLLERRLSLNLINKIRVGIIVGAYDYVIQGKPERIKKFLNCFSDYVVTAQTLFPDGHWYSERHDGMDPRPLYLQVQGVVKGSSAADLLVRHSLGRVLKKLDALALSRVKLGKLVDQVLDEEPDPEEMLELLSPLSAAKQLREYAAGVGAGFRKLLTEIAEAKTLKEKVTILMKFFEENPGGEEWTQPRAVFKHKSVTLRLTPYPRPDSTVRSTRRMDSNRVTLGEIGDALEEINFKN